MDLYPLPGSAEGVEGRGWAAISLIQDLFFGVPPRLAQGRAAAETVAKHPPQPSENACEWHGKGVWLCFRAFLQQSPAAGGAPDWWPARKGWPPTEKSVYDQNWLGEPLWPSLFSLSALGAERLALPANAFPSSGLLPAFQRGALIFCLMRSLGGCPVDSGGL